MIEIAVRALSPAINIILFSRIMKPPGIHISAASEEIFEDSFPDLRV